MPRTLDVYLRRHLVGQLIQDENGQIAYYYAESWLNHAGAIPLSHSLPLRKGVLTATSAGDFLPASCRMKVNGRSSRKTLESVPETISPCWSKSAANAPEP